MKVLILGGTGLISGAIRAELQRRGAAVTIVTRGRSAAAVPRAVEWIRQDRHEEAGLAAMLSGRTFDAIIDTICFDAGDARQTVRIFRDKAAHIVVLSSVAAYRRPYRTIPTREDAEALCDDPEYGYGFRKAAMERALREAAGQGVAVTVVRPSLTYGDGARNVGVLRQNSGILARIRLGKPLLMFGDGTTPWSFSFAPDVARAIVGLLGVGDAIGTDFHVAGQERTLWRDLYLEFGRIVGREPIIEYLPARVLYEALPELCGHLYFEKCFPGLFDDSKLRSVLPDHRMAIGLADGLRTLVRSWDRDGLQPDPVRDRLEDGLVDAARAGGAAAARSAADALRSGPEREPRAQEAGRRDSGIPGNG